MPSGDRRASARSGLSKKWPSGIRGGVIARHRGRSAAAAAAGAAAASLAPHGRADRAGDRTATASRRSIGRGAPDARLPGDLALPPARTVALKVVAPRCPPTPASARGSPARPPPRGASTTPTSSRSIDAGEAGDLAYVAMRYVDGPSLDGADPRARRPRGAPGPARSCGRWPGPLDHIGARGLAHGDITPANILLAPGDHAYLSDFGMEAGAAEAAPGADRRALAAVAFEALAGTPPPAAGPAAASRTAPALGPRVDEALARGLAADPAALPPSAGIRGRPRRGGRRHPGGRRLARAAPAPPPPPRGLHLLLRRRLHLRLRRPLLRPRRLHLLRLLRLPARGAYRRNRPARAGASRRSSAACSRPSSW